MGIAIVVIILTLLITSKGRRPIKKVTGPIAKRMTPGGSFALLIIIVMALVALAAGGGH